GGAAAGVAAAVEDGAGLRLHRARGAGRQELPVVAGRVEGEAQHAVVPVDALLGVRVDAGGVALGVGQELVVRATAGPHDELPHPVRVGDAGADALARRERQAGETIGR